MYLGRGWTLVVEPSLRLFGIRWLAHSVACPLIAACALIPSSPEHLARIGFASRSPVRFRPTASRRCWR